MKSESVRSADGAHHDVHPPIIRFTHWINAIAIVIMIGSGWRIYNDSPLIPGFFFPDTFTLGGDPAISDAKWQNHASGGLLWHFAAMWLLVLNVGIYTGYGIWSGRLKRMLFPITLAGVLETVRATLRFDLKHEHGVYNHVQRVMYLGVMVLVIGVILSGLAIWKPVQFQTLAALFGSFQGARWVHFLCMAGIVGFLVIHVALALLVPRTLLSMTVGEIAPDKPATPASTR
jgi:thiosulfate reductase cytochrome b subunit